MKYKLRNTYPTDPQLALEAILKDRGVKNVEAFICPSKEDENYPYDLENIDLAANLLIEYLREDKRICFIIDQDCDGFTSSAILWLYIKHLFPNAKLTFTIHERKQHGIEDKIDWVIDYDICDLLIVPDAGSYNFKEHKLLYDAGIKCICLDHHLPPDEQLPNLEQVIVVNNQLSPHYPNKSLCGAGVVYKFCEVLDDKLGIQLAYNYIDLAALGEIADVMDRTDIETNYIMIEGLKNIRNKGFCALLDSQAFPLKERGIYPYKGLTPIDVAFYIAPLINAITRVGSMVEKENMFYCFIEPDRLVQSTKRGALPTDTETAAEATARCGKNAKSRQDKAKERALDIVDFKIQKNQLNDNNIIFVELSPDDNIQQELTGLIAMNVVNKYQKPCMIGRRNNQNEVQGSIRNNENFSGMPSFKKFLEESKLLNYVAGHENSAGYGISADKVLPFIQYCNSILNATDFETCYRVDYILDANDNNNELIYSLVKHPEYYGNHIEEPTFVIKNIQLAQVMAMGQNKDSMKISYNGIDYVRFKDEDFVEQVLTNRAQLLTVYGRGNINTFAGKTSLQIFVTDYEFVKDEHKYDF